jgi:rubrerythrin
MGTCEDCRICSPSALDKILLLSLTWLMTLLLLCNVEPAHKRCPICGHPLKYHRKRPAV